MKLQLEEDRSALMLSKFTEFMNIRDMRISISSDLAKNGSLMLENVSTKDDYNI